MVYYVFLIYEIFLVKVMIFVYIVLKKEKWFIWYFLSFRKCIFKFCYLLYGNLDVRKVLFNLLLLIFLINCKLFIFKNCL